MTQRKSADIAINIALVVGVIAALLWIGDTWLNKRAAAANDRLVEQYKEGDVYFDGTGTQGSADMPLVGGDYHLAFVEGRGCLSSATLNQTGSRKEVMAFDDNSVGNLLRDLPAGNYYVQGVSDTPDCAWKVKLGR